MGHQQSDTFAYYVSLGNDTQSAFMETPARDALLKLACCSSLTRDVSAPQDPTDPQKWFLGNDQELDQLKRECQGLRNHLIAEFHQLDKARCADAGRYNVYRILQRKLKARRKKIHDEAKENDIGNHMIDQNYQGNASERRELAELEFKNRDGDTVDEDSIEDQIRSPELRLRLHGLHVPKPLRKRVKVESMPTIKSETQTFPLKSATSFCPVSLGVIEIYPIAKQFEYCRKDTLKKHFRTHELPQMLPKGRQWDIICLLISDATAESSEEPLK
ncbi:hypothetical protein N7523_005503 [Penicillium sp. IBT 18751x]|nr:hypothetical protein N7523_005503 [Penicillium sp. IBT 18751x]